MAKALDTLNYSKLLLFFSTAGVVIIVGRMGWQIGFLALTFWVVGVTYGSVRYAEEQTTIPTPPDN